MITVITTYDLLRNHCDVTIGYGEDIVSVRAIVFTAIQSLDGVLTEPKPDVLLCQLGSYGQLIQVRWWTRLQRSHVMKVQDQVL